MNGVLKCVVMLIGLRMPRLGRFPRQVEIVRWQWCASRACGQALGPLGMKAHGATALTSVLSGGFLEPNAILWWPSRELGVGPGS